MSIYKIKELINSIKKTYKSKVTVWGNSNETYIECKGFTGPSKKVEKIIAEAGLVITNQTWSEGSDYTGYYYWVKD